MSEDAIIKSPLNKTFKDKFYFTFNLPDALKDLSNEYNQITNSIGVGKSSIDFSLISASIPGRTHRAEDAQYAGAHLNVSTHTKDNYDPVSITFRIDSQFANYYTIYSWMDLLWDEKEGYYNAKKIAKGSSIDDYQTKMSIISLDEYNNPVMHWIFTHAFPTSLSTIDYNYQQTDELECTATFVFSQMLTRNLAFERIRNAKFFDKRNDIK